MCLPSGVGQVWVLGLLLVCRELEGKFELASSSDFFQRRGPTLELVLLLPTCFRE